jgi:hypothetical protein
MKRPKTNKEYDGHITNTEPAMANVLECTTLYEAVIYGGLYGFVVLFFGDSHSKKTSQN